MCTVCLVGGDAIPLRRLSVDQLAVLLEGLGLGDCVTPFRAAGITGAILTHCATKESLAEEGVHMTTGRFGVLRAAVEEYAPSGVPTAFLEEARGRVQQREREEAEEARRRVEAEAVEEARRRAEAQAAEEARRRAEAQAAEEARRRAEREAAERQVAQQREREANLLRLKAEAPRKVQVL